MICQFQVGKQQQNYSSLTRQLQQIVNSKNLKLLDAKLQQQLIDPSSLILIFNHTYDAILKISIISKLKNLIKNSFLKEKEIKYFNTFLIEWFEQEMIDQSKIIIDSMLQLISMFLKYQCSYDSYQKFICTIQRVSNYNHEYDHWFLKTLNTLIDCFQTQRQLSFEKQFKKGELNRYFAIAFKILNQYHDSFENLGYKEDYHDLSMLEALKLIQNLICYDFFNTKRDNLESQFVSERSPLLIPTKRNKFERFEEFEKLKENNFLQLLNSIYETNSMIQIRCTIFDIVGDISRIQLNFFRNISFYGGFSARIITFFLNKLQNQQSINMQNFQLLRSFGKNINKTLIFFDIKNIEIQIMYQWVMYLCDFVNQQLLKINIIDPKFLKSYLTYLFQIYRAVESATCGKYLKIKEELASLKLNYQNALFKKVQQNRVSIKSKTYQSIIQCQESPLANIETIQQYLCIFKFFNSNMIPSEVDNVQQCLLKILIEFQYHFFKFSIYMEKQDRQDDVRKHLQQIKESVANLFLIQNFFEFEKVDMYYLQNSYIYIVKKLFSKIKNLNYGEILKQFLPEILINTILLNRQQHIIEIIQNVCKIFHGLNIQCPQISKKIIEMIVKYKQKQFKKRQISKLAQYFALISTNDEFNSILRNQTIQLEEMLGYLKTIYFYKRFEYFRCVMEYFLYFHSKELLKSIKFQNVRKWNLIVKIIYYIFKIDGINTIDITNKEAIIHQFFPFIKILLENIQVIIVNGVSQQLSYLCKLISKLCYLNSKILKFILQINSDQLNRHQIFPYIKINLALLTEIRIIQNPSINMVLQLLNILEQKFYSEIILENEQFLTKILIHYWPQSIEIFQNLFFKNKQNITNPQLCILKFFQFIDQNIGFVSQYTFILRVIKQYHQDFQLYVSQNTNTKLISILQTQEFNSDSNTYVNEIKQHEIHYVQEIDNYQSQKNDQIQKVDQIGIQNAIINP